MLRLKNRNAKGENTMKIRIKTVRFIVLILAIFLLFYFLGKSCSYLKPTIIPNNQTSIVIANSISSSLSTNSFSTKTAELKEFEQSDEMDELQEYLINSTKNSNRAYVTLPSWHMQVLRNYLKTHKPTRGLPSVGLSFTGVQIWDYNTISICLDDNDIMCITIGDMHYDLTNDPHVSIQDPSFDVMNTSSFEMFHQPNNITKISKGWCLEEDTLSYWEFGKKLALYDLPQTEILNFSAHRFENPSGDVVTKLATIITDSEIILASEEDLQTIFMEDMSNYYFTNNGYIFYLTNAHDLYQVDIRTGESQLKKSNVSYITAFKGWGDGSHTEFTYVTTDGTTYTGMVIM